MIKGSSKICFSVNANETRAFSSVFRLTIKVLHTSSLSPPIYHNFEHHSPQKNNFVLQRYYRGSISATNVTLEGAFM